MHIRTLLAGTALATLAAVAAHAQSYAEAPALAEQVAAGNLPPVADRLPATPEVVTPLESVGTYGGTLRSGIVGDSDQSFLLRWIGAQGLVRRDSDFQDIVPNIAESFAYNDDYTVFTFTLRDGLRWSDGAPMTVEDVRFAMEDVILNTDLGPTESRYTAGGQPVRFEITGERTVQFTFAEPNAMFMIELTRWEGQGPVYYPMHYCSQFHADYNPEAAALATAEGHPDWQSLFAAKCGHVRSAARFMNIERPTLDPWVLTAPYDGGATRVTLERNPYFWQVDTAGNQLPYVDMLDITVYQDAQALLLAAIGGQIDWQFRKIDAAINRPVLAENAEAGGYELYEMTSIGGSHLVVVLNLTHQDPEMRALFNTRDFRIALSHGIDRDALVETVMLGQSEPFQGGAFPGSDLYHEQFSTQFLAFDPDLANQMLDDLGLTARDGNGTRLMANGDPVRFTMDVQVSDQPEFIDMLELLEGDWAEIGVDIDVNAIDGTLFQARQSSNDVESAAMNSQEAWIPGQLPWSIVPVDPPKAALWSTWYASGGTEGEEPPQSVQDRLALWDQSRQTLDPVERAAIVRAMVDIAAAEFETIGTVMSPSTYGISKTGLVNVPPSMPATSVLPGPALSLPQTWYWAE